MKSLALALTSLVIALPAFAKVAPQKETSVGYAAIQLVGQTELCPTDVNCVTNGTQIEVLLTYDCNTEPQPVVASAINIGQELHVFVAAPVITHSGAPLKMCFAQGMQKQTLTFINKYGPVVLHEVNSQSAL